MKAFREADKTVMSNARCLTEGVDVPAMDMNLHLAAQGKVDIVQATEPRRWRAPGKEVGYDAAAVCRAGRQQIDRGCALKTHRL